MNWDEFYQYVKPIADRRSIEYRPMLDKVGFEWEQEKFKQEQQGNKASDVVNPFKYIEREYSLYNGIIVYSMIRNAMESGQRIIRLDKDKKGMIPYFLEAVRLDEVLAEHLEITREEETLVITINTE